MDREHCTLHMEANKRVNFRMISLAVKELYTNQTDQNKRAFLRRAREMETVLNKH